MSSATGVLGSGRAAGWEAVMFYYMYRMDVESGGNTIGVNCNGSHSMPGPITDTNLRSVLFILKCLGKGGCNFIEFANHIQRKCE